MILHDATFEALATAPVKQTDVIVARKITNEFGNVVDDGIITWTSSGILMEVKIDSVGKMLGTATKKAVVKLLGIVDGFAVKEIFQIRLGIYNNDPSVSGFSYISEGYFLVDNIDYNYEAGSTTVTMYDHMWTAAKSNYAEEVTSSVVTYPATVEEFATALASYLGVTIMDNFADLPNSQYVITQDLYSSINGATVQNAIQDIAGATGTTARISDLELVFSQYEPTAENLNSNELKTLKIGDTYGPITSVILGRVPQNDNIAIYRTAPFTNEVELVNTTSNNLTITTHGMLSGNLVRFDTTNTMPAPLVEGQAYYIHKTHEDRFQLANTYQDAVAGTNIIDITSNGVGILTVQPFESFEIQINNNEIVDDDRQAALPDLYASLVDIYWSDVKADTVGLGWHEVGDVISFTQGSTTVRAFIDEIHLTLAGSIKEQLISTVPKVAAIDYTTAGGVMKSVYNTEIKVDKQNQEITSIVSRQDTIEGQVNENFTQVNQDVDDVIITIQKSGGGNLLLNSVGFAKEQTPDGDGVNYARLVSWDYPPTYKISTNGTVTSYDSSESQNYGGISGRVIQISNNYLTPQTISLTQRVNVAVGAPLSFGVRVRNALGKGDATITISNDNDTFTINIDDATNIVWQEFKLENFLSTMPWLDVTITASTEALRLTDLRLLYGTTLQGWVQSNGEILSANVQFTKDGMRIFDDSHDTETRVTYNEFSTRRRTDNTVLFEADDTGVVTNDLKIKGSTSFNDVDATVIKMITIPVANAKAGIAFVKGADV